MYVGVPLSINNNKGKKMAKPTKKDQAQPKAEGVNTMVSVKERPIDRSSFEDAFMNLMSNPSHVDKSFWSFVIAKMQITVGRDVPTAAAGFHDNNYQLYINDIFFDNMTLNERMGVLIHECMHVVLKHLFRKGTRDHQLFNVAADMALNQSIPRDWLPEGAIFPDLFKDEKGKTWKEGLTAEQYYYLLKEEQKKQQQEKDENGDEECDNCQGSGKQPQDEGDQGDGGDQDAEDSDEETDEEGNSDKGKKGTGGDEPQEACEKCGGHGTTPGENGEYKPSNGNPDLTGKEEITIDSHELWNAINEEDEELASQMMEKILEDAQEKSRGNVPANMEEIMKLWKRAPVISWKKVLKKYISSKIGAKQGTIKRRDRRQGHRMDIKGRKTFYDTPEVVVGIDTSGSMSNEEILAGLVEINEVCKLTKSTLKVVQIDTEIKGLEEYDPKKKDFKRRGCGGTYMAAMPQFLMKEKIKGDVLIMISDMYIEDVSTDSIWNKYKTPTLWLSTSGEVPSWSTSTRGHKVMDIKKA